MSTAAEKIIGHLSEASAEMQRHSPSCLANRNWNAELARLPVEEKVGGKFFLWHDADLATGNGVGQEALQEFIGGMTPGQFREFYILAWSSPYEAGEKLQNAMFDYALRCAGVES